MKRLFLMKATKITSLSKIDSSWTWSIKFDGIRAFWDGGITRGCYDVPFCPNITATGLWSIYGNPIYAPDWWLDSLPSIPLDGELWIGPQQFNTVSSTVRKLKPIDIEWQQIRYHVFDLPGLADVYIPLPMRADHNIKVEATSELFEYMVQKAYDKGLEFGATEQWPDAPAQYLNTRYTHWVHQNSITNLEDVTQKILPALLEEGHEGIVFRKNSLVWEPIRSHGLLKLKPFLDDEGQVIGLVFGKDTDKGSRNRGRMGSLILRLASGKTFHLSGFTDAERALPESFRQFAYDHPGQEAPNEIQSELFPWGTIVTFRYRELTPDGLPKDARYWRYAPTYHDIYGGM